MARGRAQSGIRGGAAQGGQERVDVGRVRFVVCDAGAEPALAARETGFGDPSHALRSQPPSEIGHRVLPQGIACEADERQGRVVHYPPAGLDEALPEETSHGRLVIDQRGDGLAFPVRRA